MGKGLEGGSSRSIRDEEEGVLVCAATLLRWAGAYPALIVVAAVALAAGALVIVALNRRAYRFEASALADERSDPNAAAVFLLSAMTLGTGGLGLYLVVSAGGLS